MDPRNVEPKWPLTHGERVVELQNVLQDPQKAIFHENIRAAIKYHPGFGQQELCSEQLIYFQNGRQVSEDERDGICWMEVCLCMSSSKWES